MRRVKEDDAEILLYELGQDKDITKYTGWNPYLTIDAARSRVAEDIKSYERLGFYAWIIQYSNDIVGAVGAYGYDADVSSIEIGYSVFKKFWGVGFNSEAVSEVVRYLFEDEKINRIHACCHYDDVASSKVLENAGLRQEGVLKEAIKNKDGSLSDIELYGEVFGNWKK